MASPGDSPLLSILIPTMVKREKLFLELLGGLLPQCERSAAPVEVVALQNAGEQMLAAYRDALLKDARGRYLCFIDDDDAVPGYYAEEITAALADDPDVVTFIQNGTGTAAAFTLFSLQFTGAPWEPVPAQGLVAGKSVLVYLRAYSHVQPIRAEIARQASFSYPGALGYTQEDQVFAHDVVPLLIDLGAKERHIPRIMYTYRFMHAGESTQQGAQLPDGGVHVRPVITSPCFRWCGQ